MHRVCSISLPFASARACTSLLMVVLGAYSAIGQPSQGTTGSTVQTAAFDRAPPRDSQQSVRFGRRPARIGDETEQTISLEMRLATSLRKGNELIERSRTVVRTAQRRRVETAEVDAGRATAVVVRYAKATKQITATDADAPEAAADVSPKDQPIAGKAYRCRREPGDEGKLVITDEEGYIPPLGEYEIVAQHMEMVGRANPLAQFLAGRTVAVGESLELPREVADAVFNLSDRFGDVTQFNLTLDKSQTLDGAACAVFLARVEAASSDASQMRLQVEGPIVVQLDTCRAVRIDLSGPIGMSETRGSYSTAYQMLGTGRLKMSIASVYRDAKR